MYIICGIVTNNPKQIGTFFIDKSQVYKNDQLNYFAVNLGGEILRWSLKAMDRDLYKEEPYKRLWIMGTPCVITFKVKLDDIYEHNYRSEYNPDSYIRTLLTWQARNDMHIYFVKKENMVKNNL